MRADGIHRIGRTTTMLLGLYNVLLVLASPIILLVLLAKRRCRRGLLYRLGVKLPAWPSAGGPAADSVIWIHAVSLGEVVAVTPLVKLLHARYPSRPLVVSTVTETGREAVEQRLTDIAVHCYAPLDYPWAVARLIERLRPGLYLFVETELWPNLLTALAACGVPTVMLNGRISSRSFARQQWPIVRHVYRFILRRLSLCLMQSDRDAQRIVALGADSRKVLRTGNIKFDQPPVDLQQDRLATLTGWISRQSSPPVLVAGSTHPGEEEILISACEELRKDRPLVLILAPRHIERTEEVERMLAQRGLSYLRRSRLAKEAAGPAGASEPWVLLLDTRGELGAVYHEAAIAFVGGTLAPVGGHNLLEPAAWGKPVLFGPHTDHCEEIAQVLESAGGGIRVWTVDQIVEVCRRLLDDPVDLNRVGELARSAFYENQGALDRSLDAMAGFLEDGSSQIDRMAPATCSDRTGSGSR
ncbi:MAG: 3-deoxy-D-manno-octulosonic acid transferase [Nitrospiraceae bacterium]